MDTARKLNVTLAVNTEKSAKKKKKPRGKPFRAGKGVDARINRVGAPVRGQSYAEAVKRLSDMTNEELADFFGRNTPMGQQFLLLPKDVVSRDVVIGRAIITLSNDFDARGFGQLTDRSEGKPEQGIDFKNSDGSLKPESMSPSEILARADALRKQIKDANSG